MAQWQIINPDGEAENFNDEQVAGPGEPGFTTDAVRAQAGDRAFNYLGASPNREQLVAEEKGDGE